MTFLYCPVSLAKLLLLHSRDTEYVYIQLMILLEISPCSVLHVASYWRLLLIECLRCWLLHGEISGLELYIFFLHSANILGVLCIWEFGPLVTTMTKDQKMIPLAMTKI